MNPAKGEPGLDLLRTYREAMDLDTLDNMTQIEVEEKQANGRTSPRTKSRCVRARPDASEQAKNNKCCRPTLRSGNR